MLPTELEEQLSVPMAIGETTRIPHQSCSAGKTSALAIRRTVRGWLWHCFRCGFSGFKAANSLSPAEVMATLNRLQLEEPMSVLKYATLPMDYERIVKVYSAKIPKDAFTWLWKYHITNDIIQKYEIGWSDYYKRIIFPVYDTTLLNNKGDTSRLIGWFGRDPFFKKTEERTEKVVPKWLIQKSKGLTHFYYHIANDSSRMVLVEDVLSAIRVNHAAGCQTMALGTTFIPNELVMKLKNLKVIIWLDGDMLSKAVNYIAKFRSFGIDASYKHTPWDPKEYGVSKIKAILGEE